MIRQLRRRGLCRFAARSARALHVVFVSDETKDEMRVECEAGEDLLEIAHANDIDIEGARECTGRCRTPMHWDCLRLLPSVHNADAPSLPTSSFVYRGRRRMRRRVRMLDVSYDFAPGRLRGAP